MLSAEEKLKELGLTVRESDAPDRTPIDFSIEDGNDNVCWVWGDTPEDLEIECDHPDNCVEYCDDETVGECLLCGKTCDWHWQPDGEGGKERVPHSWHEGEGGIIKQYLRGD